MSARSRCELQPQPWKLSWGGGRAPRGLAAPGALTSRSPQPGREEAAAAEEVGAGGSGPCLSHAPGEAPSAREPAGGAAGVRDGSALGAAGHGAAPARLRSRGPPPSGPGDRRGDEARGAPGSAAEVGAALGQRRESVSQPSGRRRSRRRSRLSGGRRSRGGGRGVESRWRPRWRSSSGGGGGGWSELPARRAERGPGVGTRAGAASCSSGPGARRLPRSASSWWFPRNMIVCWT
ncbi:hypothetical protein VULLAG_LOCUS21624 [Vulpes lagopus]